jgi:hypothetical protein
MLNEIMSIIENLNDSPEIEYINSLKNNEVSTISLSNEYVLVKANKGSATHLAKFTNLVNNKYHIGCGSFSTNRMKEVIVTPLEIKPENIGCKKCRIKLEQLINKK